MILQGHTLRTETGVSDVGCTEKCVEHKKCRSYNIDLANKVCKLNSKALGDNGTVLVPKSGWIYKSTDYNQTSVSLEQGN